MNRLRYFAPSLSIFSGCRLDGDPLKRSDACPLRRPATNSLNPTRELK